MDDEGRILATARAEYPLCYPQPGWVEQDPEDWWRTLCQAVQGVLRAAGIPRTDIRSVALSGQINGVDDRGLWLGR